MIKLFYKVFKAKNVVTYYNQQGPNNTPIAFFTFNFWQNTKYTYRSVADVNSHEVKANEEQMDKALAKIYLLNKTEESHRRYNIFGGFFALITWYAWMMPTPFRINEVFFQIPLLIFIIKIDNVNRPYGTKAAVNLTRSKSLTN